MKELTYSLQKALSQGLRPSKRNPRNTPMLVECVGAVPRDGVLQALEQFSRIDTSALAGVVFPYPQLIVGIRDLIICTQTAMYEIIDDVLTEMISSLTPGATWAAVDFQQWWYITNGKDVVVKSATSKEYSVSTDMPHGFGACNFNGQLLVGSPDVSWTAL